MKGFRFRIAGTIVLLLFIATEGWGGPLEKFQLPPAQQSTPNQYKMKSFPFFEQVPNLPVYRDFQAYAEELPPDQIDQIIKTYSKRQLEAVKRRDREATSYYNNLINILLDERSRR